MFNILQNLKRTRIVDNRNYHTGLFLNRAERVEPLSNDILSQLYDEIDFKKLGYYHDNTDLYEKYSKYLSINEQELLITNGAEEAIRYIFNIFIEKNDKIMFPIPTYGMYHVYSKIYQTTSIILEYNNFKINKKKLYENLKDIKVFFLPNPSHIEDLFLIDEIENICKIMQKTKGILVIDETYYGFDSPTMIELINKYNNIFIIRSFSKTFGLPSIRCGVLIGNIDTMKIISNYRPAYEIPYPTYKICHFFLDNISIIDKYIQECKEGRKYIIDTLLDNNIEYNGDNNYLINILLKNENLVKKINNFLLEKYIYIKTFENIISITIGPKKYMEKFMKNFLFIYKE